MTAKVRSFGNTTPRSSLSHEISTKVERGLVMWFASQLIRRFIHHKRFANTYSVTCRFAFQSLSTAIRATRQQGAETSTISMETNLTVANLQSDSAHDILQVYKQIHTCTYTLICTNTYIASVSPCRLPVTSYVTSQCRSWNRRTSCWKCRNAFRHFHEGSDVEKVAALHIFNLHIYCFYMFSFHRKSSSTRSSTRKRLHVLSKGGMHQITWVDTSANRLWISL